MHPCAPDACRARQAKFSPIFPQLSPYFFFPNFCPRVGDPREGSGDVAIPPARGPRDGRCREPGLEEGVMFGAKASRRANVPSVPHVAAAALAPPMSCSQAPASGRLRPPAVV